MSNKIEYSWDNGFATCIIKYKNISFYGRAFCHPQDDDMCSDLTGCYIAEQRATIKVLRHIRDNELKPQLQSLKQLYYAMNRSKKFNPKSYEAKSLFSHINNLKADIEAIEEEIKVTKRELKQYLDEKDKLYTRLRKVKKEQSNQETDHSS